MTHYAMKPGCEYARWNKDSSWKAFYHEENYATGSGPSKESQKLALWYPGICTDWPYIAIKGILPSQLKAHYNCNDDEIQAALDIIHEFVTDVESRFV